jgi:predicted dinucleotide-binding enzyme
MRIGVIGSGPVGQTLAQGFKKHGYETRIASRSPEKLAEFSKRSGIQAGTPADVAAWAEAVVLAVKGDAAEAALHEAGAANVNGKLVIDTTNPIAHEPPEDGVLRFFTSPNDSLMERLQTACPGAKFVKAFNSVGASCMVNPQFAGGKPTMFIAGNDAAAKAIAERILDTRRAALPTVTWGRRKRPARLSHSASSGASPASEKTRGHMHSHC